MLLKKLKTIFILRCKEECLNIYIGILSQTIRQFF